MQAKCKHKMTGGLWKICAEKTKGSRLLFQKKGKGSP